MKKIKLFIKKVISFSLKLVIPVVDIFSITKKDVNVDDNEIRKLYSPTDYKAKKYTNQKISSNIDLSIIIPVYNSERYIKECLDSIFNNKTEYQYEVICINDGSIDSSLDILNTYKEKNKNLIIISQENGGAASAKNTGIDKARGKYIAFIDCDDYVSDNYIEKLLNIAFNYDSDIVKCGYYRTFENSIEKNRCIEIKTNDGLGSDVLKIEGFLCMSVIKRELLFDIRLPEGYWYEDMISRPLILHKCKKFVGISDCLYYYRQHSSNISKTVEHSTDYRCLSQFYLANYIIDYAKTISLDINDSFKLIMLKEYGIMSYSRLGKLPKDIKKKVFLLEAKEVKHLNIHANTLVDFSDKYFYKAFEKKSYLLYILVGMYTKWK